MAPIQLAFVWEQLHGAVAGLVCSEASLRERLLLAASWRLQQIFPPDFPTHELPPVVLAGIQAVQAKLTQKGSIAASIAEMDDDAIVSVLEEVVDLFGTVAGVHAG